MLEQLTMNELHKLWDKVSCIYDTCKPDTVTEQTVYQSMEAIERVVGAEVVDLWIREEK